MKKFNFTIDATSRKILEDYIIDFINGNFAKEQEIEASCVEEATVSNEAIAKLTLGAELIIAGLNDFNSLDIETITDETEIAMDEKEIVIDNALETISKLIEAINLNK